MASIASFIGTTGPVLSIVACFVIHCLWTIAILTYTCTLPTGVRHALFWILACETGLVAVFTLRCTNEQIKAKNRSVNEGLALLVAIFYTVIVTLIGLGTLDYCFFYQKNIGTTTRACNDLDIAGFGLFYVVFLLVIVAIVFRSWCTK